ncbi:hypothetical protein ACOMCU_15890 [Lysinibacillus sp. UGB7]|uniref:hypothetical protein n=1 Tax=Lysinibacillus sp. UGB7 TaxID=3411039 RepID=UPI003B81CA8C
MSQRKYKKLIARSSFVVLLISAIGGGVYLAEQDNNPTAMEKKVVLENPTAAYIEKIYVTYIDEIVHTWNLISNGDTQTIQETKNKIIEWKALLLQQQEEVYEPLNTPVEHQIDTLEKFLALSQENVSVEQRKGLRELSRDFIEGHELVKEGLFLIFNKQEIEYSVAADGTIEYQFKGD